MREFTYYTETQTDISSFLEELKVMRKIQKATEGSREWEVFSGVTLHNLNKGLESNIQRIDIDKKINNLLDNG